MDKERLNRACPAIISLQIFPAEALNRAPPFGVAGDKSGNQRSTKGPRKTSRKHILGM
jgi:hypothetical protein